MIGTKEAAEMLQVSQKVVRDRIVAYDIDVTYLNAKTMMMTDKAFHKLAKKFLQEQRDALVVLQAHVNNLEAVAK